MRYVTIEQTNVTIVRHPDSLVLIWLFLIQKFLFLIRWGLDW